MLRHALAGALVSLTALSACLGAVGCASGTTSSPTVLPSDLKSPFTGYSSPQYRDAKRWLCLPGRSDTCAGDLTATEIRADGTTTVLGETAAKDAPVDCFYVYPTVDDRLFVAANHEDFGDVKAVAFSTSGQVAQFGQVCSLYVPLYRQVTLGTYFRNPEQREAGLAVAFSDIEDAFLHYLANYNHGRKVVLIGHSQGAEMVKRLLLKFFDEDAALRERLLVAMPIGTELDTAIGRTTGGTFKNIPACSHDEETGCVIAFRSAREGANGYSIQEVPPGRRAMCVNPGSLAEPGERATLQTYFPRFHLLLGQDDVKTPFVFYRDLYSARCVDGPAGKRLLEVSENDEPDGLRVLPVDLGSWRWGTKMGTHILDLQFPLGTLIETVRRLSRASHRTP
jgi:hypothetical protein